MSLRSGCMVRTICGQLVTSCLHLGRFFLRLGRFFLNSPYSPPHPTLPSPPPSHPPPHNTGLLSPVLLNKIGLVRAKAGNFNLKSLNKCFSNYYQVRTRPVFAETVTYIHAYSYVRLLINQKQSHIMYIIID